MHVMCLDTRQVKLYVLHIGLKPYPNGLLKGVAIFGESSNNATHLHVYHDILLYVMQGLSSKLHIGLRPHPKGLLRVTRL